ncbi:MAG: hypothetical protein KIT14_20560 [bacterium]|nr:hypothetical protein [bacterium]
MSGRTILATAAAVMLSLGLMVSPAPAKGGPKCPKLCRSEISACKAECTGTKKEKGKCKRACKKELVNICKAQPAPRSSCLPASPSGAFLN